VNAEFVLSKDYAADQKSPAQIDLIQLGAPDNPDKIVGGQRFTVDLRKITLVKSGDLWRYWDRREAPGENWTSVDYNDARWSQGSAPLGSGGNQATTLAAGSLRLATTYFRHTFEVDEPGFYRNLLLRIGRGDGVIVFLNGREVYRVNLPAGRLKSEALATRAGTGLEGEVFVPVKIDPAQLKSGKNVLAAEIHANSRPGHIEFDLELLANTTGATFPPNVAFAGLVDGSMFETDESVPVRVEALSGDAKIDSVTLYVDGRNVGTKKSAPYEFALPSGSPGQHRLRAVTLDSRGLTSSSTRTVVIVEHVLPLVKLIEPVSSKVVSAGQAIPVSAEASVRRGKIARVEFWVKDMATFTSPSILAATATAAPYSVSIKDLKPGHYMYWAIAVNDHGGTTQSYPGHLLVEARK
jgi:hypothetical protein